MERNKVTILIFLIAISFTQVVSAQPKNTLEPAADLIHVFSNGNRLKASLPKKLVSFVRKSENGNIGQEVRLFAGEKINRFYDNSKSFNQGDGIGKIVPSFIGKQTDGTKKDVYFASVQYELFIYGQMIVLEVGKKLYIANDEGNKFEIKLPEGIEFKRYGKQSLSYEWEYKFHEPNMGLLLLKINGSSSTYGIVVNKFGATEVLGEVKSNQDIEYTKGNRSFYIKEKTMSSMNSFEKSFYIGSLLDEVTPSPTTFEKIKAQEALTPNPISLKKEGRPREVDASAQVQISAGKNINVKETVEQNFRNFTDLIYSGNYQESLPDDAIDKDELLDIRGGLNVKPGGSVMIVGEPGSGKSELIRKYVEEVFSGKFPEIHSETRFLYVDPLIFSTGDGHINTQEAKLQALIKYAQYNDVVLIIENIHNLKGSGAHSASSIDDLQKITQYIVDGSVKVIATTTEDYYQKYFVADPIMGRAMSKVTKRPIKEEKIHDALEIWAKRNRVESLSKAHRELIIGISKRYASTGHDLGKALALQAKIVSEMEVNGLSVKNLTDDIIYKTASRAYGLPRDFFDFAGRQRVLKNLAKDFKEKVAGYESLKADLIQDATNLITGASSSTEPEGRRIFIGDKGLGKTYIPTVYASSLGLNFVRIKLDYDTRPTDIKVRIANSIKKDPMTVFLIDEIEKAPLATQNSLLDILDSSEISTAQALDAHLAKPGETYIIVRTSNATFFLATNAGAGKIKKDMSVEQIVEILVEDKLSEYLIDRAADLNIFTSPETKEEFKEVLKIQLAQEIIRIQKEKSIKVKLTNEQEFLDKLTDRYFRPRASFRASITDLKKAITASLSKYILETPPTKLAHSNQCTLTLNQISSIFNSRPKAREKPPMGFGP